MTDVISTDPATVKPFFSPFLFPLEGLQMIGEEEIMSMPPPPPSFFFPPRRFERPEAKTETIQGLPPFLLFSWAVSDIGADETHEFLLSLLFFNPVPACQNA